MLTAIIVAAGTSRRLGFDKLSASIAGKPLIVHTVEAFEQSRCVNEIVVVTRAERIKEFEQLLQKATKVKKVVGGGEHRHNSVEAGLHQLNESTDYVAVH